jgi:hypothetical protein
MLPKPQTFAPSFLKYAVLKQQNCQQNAMTPGAGGIPGSSFYSSGFQHRPGTRLTWQDFLRCPPPLPRCVKKIHDSGGQSLASHIGSPDSIPGQSFGDLLCICDRSTSCTSNAHMCASCQDFLKVLGFMTPNLFTEGTDYGILITSLTTFSSYFFKMFNRISIM